MGNPSSNSEIIESFLAQRDAPCPRCGYNLRGAASNHGPECGQPLVLSIAEPDPRTTWDVLALLAVVLTTLYFAVRALGRILMLSGGVHRGTSLADLRLELAVNALVELVIAVVGTAWCVLIFRHRRERPRPMWARPTTAASVLLLAVFVAFLLAYGIRTML